MAFVKQAIYLQAMGWAQAEQEVWTLGSCVWVWRLQLSCAVECIWQIKRNAITHTQ